MEKLQQAVNELKTMGRDNPDRKAKLKEVIELMAQEILPEAREIVKMIEAKVETTRGHYGDYMAVLSDYQGLLRFAMARALILAGASHEGMQGASMVLNQ